MLKDKIIETIKKYNMIESGEGIVVGVSGGPDSMCLLNNLIEINNDENNNLRFKLYVAHINHMMRKEAEEETKYVQEFCKKNNIDCYVKMEDIKKISKNLKKGTEETGRKIRYEFFEEIMNKTQSSKIAIAHNLNDKVETILMNIIRGCGPSGLKGIEAVRDNKLIRPLLEIERREIEKYCNEKKLNPKIDQSNFENIYTRNKIRNIVLPYIKEQFNPNIIENVSRLSNIIRDILIPNIEKEYNPNIINAINKLSKITEEEQNYLDRIVNNIYNKLVINKTNLDSIDKNNQIILDLKKFNNLDIVIKRKLILYTIKKVYGNSDNVEKIHIDDIIKLCENNIGNKYLTPHKNIKILVKKSKIFFIALS